MSATVRRRTVYTCRYLSRKTAFAIALRLVFAPSAPVGVAKHRLNGTPGSTGPQRNPKASDTVRQRLATEQFRENSRELLPKEAHHIQECYGPDRGWSNHLYLCQTNLASLVATELLSF